MLRSIKTVNLIWLEMIELMNDTLDQTQKENIFSVLNILAPKNSELSIELDNKYQHKNINGYENIRNNAKDEAYLFYEKISLSQFGKDQILNYFQSLKLSEFLKNEDSLLLPLFKAAEDHLSTYLKNQGIEFGSSTDLSHLLNRLKDHINRSPNLSHFKSKWRREKGKFFRIVDVRNATAHASAFDASLIGPTQENVKKLLYFIEELRH